MIPLRPATADDAPVLGAILQGWLDETDWMPDLHSLEETQAHLGRVIAEQEVWVAGDHQGYLSWDGEYVSGLYLAPEHRSGGIGSTMLAHMMIRQPRLRLWTFQANTRARNFYIRRGFVEVKRTEGETNQERLPDVLLEWQDKKRPDPKRPDRKQQDKKR